MFFTKRHLEVVITWADNGGWIVYIGGTRRIYVNLKALMTDLEDYCGEPDKDENKAAGVPFGDDGIMAPWTGDHTTTGGDCDV